MRKILIAILSAIAFLSFSMFAMVGCNCSQPDPVEPEVPRVALSQTNLELRVCDTHTLLVENYEGERYWTSTDKNICTVDEEGKITADNIGESQIICYYDDGFLLCYVNVVEMKTPVEQAKLNSSSLVLYRQDEYQLKVVKNVGEDSVDGGTTTWSSSNENLVTVSNTGVVKALALNPVNEPVVITAIHTSGDNVYTFTCKVNVILNVNIQLEEQCEELVLYTGFGEYKLALTAEIDSSELNSGHVISNDNFIFAVEDNSIAQISYDGTITPKKGGRTRVLVSYNDYDYRFIDLLVYNKLIYSKDDFIKIQPSDYSLLMNDLDFTKQSVAGGIVIDGLFNGNGYSLNNITLVPNDYESITGKQLFGKVTGEIKNLEVHNFKVKKFWDAMCGASALMANASGTVENVIFDGFIEGRVAIDYNGTAYTTWSGATGGYLMKSSNNATVKNIYIDIERDDDSDDLRITHGAGTLNYDNVYVVSKAKQSTTYTSYNVINNGFFSVGTEKNFVDNYYSNVDTQMWYIGADNKPLLKNGLEALDLPEGLLEIKLYSEGTAGSLLEKNYINTIYYSPNSTIESLPEASKEDHILKTWTNITEGKTAAIGDKITQNLTYVANWARVWFATFDSNGGSLVDPIRVENGKTLTADGVTRIPEPTLKDKAFCCWQELVKDGVKVEKENKLVCTYNFETEVLTIEEEFKDLVEQEIVTAIVDEIDCSILKVKLYVDKNKEDYNVIEINLTNKTFTITDSNTACTAVDCKNATVATAEKDTVSCTSKKLKVSFTFPTFSFSTAFEKDYNLIAHWVDVVKVSFDANGGSPVSAINVGKGLTIKEKNMPTASRDGYTFIGWHLVSVLKDVEGNPVLDENGQEVTIVAEEVFDLSTVITEPIKLQAAWTPNVTLKFNSNGAGSVNDLQVGKNLTLAASRVPSPTRAGYILLGWVLDGETELYDFTTRAFTDDASFTAKWQECATVIDFASSSYANSIIDIANPVTSTDFKFVTDGASLKVAVESRKDLTFKLNANDWSKYNTIIFRISHDSMNASNWFLTADTSKSIWHYKNELDNYGYQHYGRLGSWVEVKLVAKDNAKYDLYYNNVLRAQDVAIKKNSATNVYEFPVQFYNDQLVESNFYVSNVIGIEDYATLTFDENYASKASEVYVTKGLKIATSIVPQPQREGYQFLGWVKQGETEVYTFTNAVFTEDTTFVAQWVATPAIINFSEQGAINSVTGVSGYKGYSISTAASYNYGLETASLKLAVDSQKTGEIKLDISKWGGYKEIMFRVAHDGLNNSAYFCFADTSKSIWNHTNVLGNYGLQHYGRVGNWATIKLVAKDGGLYDMYYNNFLRAENVSIGNAFGIIVFNNTTAAHNFYISNIVGVEDSVTLTYNEGYDSKTSVVKVTNGLTVGASQIPAPTREGYKFLGWIKQGETELFDFTNAKFTEATTFNASWEETPVLINFAKPDALSKVSSESGYTDYSVTTDVAFTGETSSLRFGVDAETSKYVLLDTTGWSNYAEVIFRITHDCYNHSAYFATVDKDNSVFNIDSVVGHYGFQMWGQKGRWLEVKLVFNTDGTYNLYYNDVLRGENLTLNSTFAIKGYNEQVSDPHNIIVSNVIAVPKATSEN